MYFYACCIIVYSPNKRILARIDVDVSLTLIMIVLLSITSVVSYLPVAEAIHEEDKNNSVKVFPEGISTQFQGLPISEDVEISDLPKSLTVTDNSKSKNLPLRALVTDGIVTQVDKQSNIRQVKFNLDDWNQAITFHFNRPSKVGLVNLENVLVGQIKSYESVEDALEDATLWEGIPLSEEVILSFDKKGHNFMIVEVGFVNGASGIYYGTFELDAFGTRSQAEDALEREMDEEDTEFNIMEDSEPEIDLSNPFWQISQLIVCEELRDNGFQVCS